MMIPENQKEELGAAEPVSVPEPVITKVKRKAKEIETTAAATTTSKPEYER
jgi:hypothetical protein